jgi:hypothetical protein
MTTAPLSERCNGRWRSILPALGINPQYLSGKNGPCPLCREGRDAGASTTSEVMAPGYALVAAPARASSWR